MTIDTFVQPNAPGSIQVRQSGRGSFQVTGTHLAGVTGCSVANGDCITSSVTDTTMQIDIGANSGAPLGFRDLIVTGSDGTLTLEDGVEITPTVVSTTPDQNFPRGTRDYPFRTFREAIGKVGDNDTLEIETGEYNQANGETFTEVGTATTAARNVTIVAVGGAVTFVGLSSTTTLAGFVSDGGVTIDGVNFSNLHLGVGSTSAAPVVLKNVTVAGCNTGIDVHTLTADSLNVEASVANGVQIVDGSLTTFFVSNSGGDGIVQNGLGTVALSDGVIDGNGSNGAAFSGGVTVTVDTVDFDANGGVGLRLDEGSLSVTGSTFENHAGIGLSGFGAASVTVAATSFVDNTTHVNLNGNVGGAGAGELTIGTSSFINGTNAVIADVDTLRIGSSVFNGQTQAPITVSRVDVKADLRADVDGGNSINGFGSSVGVVDARAENPGGNISPAESAVLELTGTAVNGAISTNGTLTCGPNFVAPFFSIATSGNCVRN